MDFRRLSEVSSLLEGMGYKLIEQKKNVLLSS